MESRIVRVFTDFFFFSLIRSKSFWGNFECYFIFSLSSFSFPLAENLFFGRSSLFETSCNFEILNLKANQTQKSKMFCFFLLRSAKILDRSFLKEVLALQPFSSHSQFLLRDVLRMQCAQVVLVVAWPWGQQEGLGVAVCPLLFSQEPAAEHTAGKASSVHVFSLVLVVLFQSCCPQAEGFLWSPVLVWDSRTGMDSADFAQVTLLLCCCQMKEECVAWNERWKRKRWCG